MNASQCWEIVRPLLAPCDAVEVEDACPVSIAEYVAAAERVRDRERTSEPAWTLWRDVLSAWAREQTDAREVVRALTLLDRRLGVWCACAVARVAMPYLYAGAIASYAIKDAERWVRGEVSAHVFFANASDSEAADYAARIAADTIYFAIAGAAPSRPRDLREFCAIAADAVLSMPWDAGA